MQLCDEEGKHRYGHKERMGKMILTDYLRHEEGIQWDYALQCGVTNAVIRLPEMPEFDVTDGTCWRSLCEKFEKRGLHPLVVEPLPNILHDHIKTGDELRDVCIEKVIRMFPHMSVNGIHTLCFNFMAYEGWTRTCSNLPERGGALVTGFDLNKYHPQMDVEITKEELWDNYTCFVRAVVPEAEKWGIRLALHPDDPPLPRLGRIERIMISYENIRHAMEIAGSPNVGVTMCQASYAMMGEDLYQVIPKLADRIFFIHFRNVTGNGSCFRETFHDNGDLDMAELLRLYQRCGIDVPIRVDHVPVMSGETNDMPGYTALGRLFAIGYLKGLLDGIVS